MNATNTTNGGDDDYAQLTSHARWVLWSFSYTPGLFNSTAINLIFFSFFSSMGMLWHSYYLKGKTFTSVRALCDLANAANIVACVCYLIASSHTNNNLVFAVCNDFMVNGVTSVVIQLADNMMFYSRFIAVKGKETGLLKRYAILTYTIITMYFTWAPAYVLVPFFKNVDDPDFLDLFSQLLLSNFFFCIAYNVYFTLEFGKILFDHAFGRHDYSPRVISVSVKSMLHMIFSSTAVYFYQYPIAPQYANITFNIILTYSLHFLWNARIEAGIPSFGAGGKRRRRLLRQKSRKIGVSPGSVGVTGTTGATGSRTTTVVANRLTNGKPVVGVAPIENLEPGDSTDMVEVFSLADKYQIEV